MKKNALLTVLLFLSLLLNAQEKPITTIVADKDAKLLSSSSFLFLEYQDATFYSKQGIGRAKMNYNMLTGEMMFIKDKDTMILINPQDITLIRIGTKRFIYKSKDYLEILQDVDNKMLLVRRRIKPAAVQQQSGVYGVATVTSSLNDISLPNGVSISEEQRINTPKIETYEVMNTFYLQSGNSLYVGATEKNFQKVFGADKKTCISNYVKENKLNLNNQEDVIQLFHFCEKKE